MKPVEASLDQLAHHIRRAAARPTPAAVHDLRVATRRTTAALALFPEAIPNAKKLRRQLKSIRRLAALVRDRDVTRALLLRHGLPPTDPALIYLKGQRDLAAQQLQAFLATEPCL